MADDKVKCHGCGAPTTGAKYCERCQTELDNITAYVSAWKQVNDDKLDKHKNNIG